MKKAIHIKELRAMLLASKIDNTPVSLLFCGRDGAIIQIKKAEVLSVNYKPDYTTVKICQSSRIISIKNKTIIQCNNYNIYL